MGRAKGNLLDNLMALPWPVGGLEGNMFARTLMQAANLVSCFVLVVGLLGAAMSWGGQRQRRRLLDAQ